MPWKHNGTEIKVGKAWVADNGTQHPAQWSRWSDEKKTSEGLTWENPPASEASYDDRFYSGRKADGSLIEKSLTDVDAVDADGKAILNPITGKQEIILGLKSIWIERTKAMAQDKLNEHDWMIVRNAEKSTAIPSDITTYRDAVRTKCTSIETAINNCSNLTEFMALFDAPVDSDGNPTGDPAPINDFPDEI
jgi:hypothetical protein